MVRTSMLPVSGTTELSAMPSKTSPKPPRWRNRLQVDRTSKISKCADIRSFRGDFDWLSGMRKLSNLLQALEHLESANKVQWAMRRILRHSDKRDVSRQDTLSRDSSEYSWSSSA